MRVSLTICPSLAIQSRDLVTNKDGEVLHDVQNQNQWAFSAQVLCFLLQPLSSNLKARKIPEQD